MAARQCESRIVTYVLIFSNPDFSINPAALPYISYIISFAKRCEHAFSFLGNLFARNSHFFSIGYWKLPVRYFRLNGGMRS